MNTRKSTLTVVLIAALAVSALAQQQYDSESDFETEREGNGITITGYLGSKKEVRIPPGIQDLPVTCIGERAFAGKTEITRITIPNGVIKIETNAFINCKNLAGVTIPDSVTYIEQYAFLYSGINVITIPKSVTYIGGGAFGGCSKLYSINVNAENKDYSSMSGVLYNKSRTFLHTYPAGKTDSSVFTIPGTLLAIGDYAFVGCSRIVSIGIPASVKEIGIGAFLFCDRLSKLTVASGNTAYLTENDVLYNKSRTFLHTYPAGRTGGSFSIPDSVKSIGTLAFAACTRLKSITFEGTIPYGNFEYDAFRGLGDLRDKFYETDKKNGTTGMYTRDDDMVWTRQVIKEK